MVRMIMIAVKRNQKDHLDTPTSTKSYFHCKFHMRLLFDIAVQPAISGNPNLHNLRRKKLINVSVLTSKWPQIVQYHAEMGGKGAGMEGVEGNR